MQLPDFYIEETDEEMPHDDYFGAKVVKCAECGGREFEFEVGSGAYLTLIRCVACKGVTLVHSG